MFNRLLNALQPPASPPDTTMAMATPTARRAPSTPPHVPTNPFDLPISPNHDPTMAGECLAGGGVPAPAAPRAAGWAAGRVTRLPDSRRHSTESFELIDAQVRHCLLLSFFLSPYALGPPNRKPRAPAKAPPELTRGRAPACALFLSQDVDAISYDSSAESTTAANTPPPDVSLPLPPWSSLTLHWPAPRFPRPFPPR